MSDGESRGRYQGINYPKKQQRSGYGSCSLDCIQDIEGCLGTLLVEASSLKQAGVTAEVGLSAGKKAKGSF